MPTSCHCDRTFEVINIRFADIAFGSLPQASFQKYSVAELLSTV